MVHCRDCCLRLSLTKGRTLPRHYDYSAGFISWARERECDGSGTTRFVHDRDLARCRRPRSGHRCPKCGRGRITLNKNGKYPVHTAPNGSRCDGH